MEWKFLARKVIAKDFEMKKKIKLYGLQETHRENVASK